MEDLEEASLDVFSVSGGAGGGGGGGEAMRKGEDNMLAGVLRQLFHKAQDHYIPQTVGGMSSFSAMTSGLTLEIANFLISIER